MNVLICCLIIIIIIFSKFVFKVNYKKAKGIQENKKLEIITDKFPDNLEIAKDILSMLKNESVKIEEAKNTKTSLYIAITNKISIADMKSNYSRILTISHECAHSIQGKRLLISNFIFSNITIIYFFIILVLGVFNIISNNLYITIFSILLLTQYAIRSYLEIDAMTKSKYIAKDYVESKNLVSISEKQELLDGYEQINKVGIPFVIYNLLMSTFIKELIILIVFII